MFGNPIQIVIAFRFVSRPVRRCSALTSFPMGSQDVLVEEKCSQTDDSNQEQRENNSSTAKKMKNHSMVALISRFAVETVIDIDEVNRLIEKNILELSTGLKCKANVSSLLLFSPFVGLCLED